MVRTGLSNLDKLIVHFFDARQRNEPKKTCVRGVHSPYVSPGLCAFCTYGPKLFGEAASQKPRCLAVSLAKCRRFGGKTNSPFRRVRNIASVLSLGAERKVKAVGEGLHSLVNALLPLSPLFIIH